jgi:hypothetical protein
MTARVTLTTRRTYHEAMRFPVALLLVSLSLPTLAVTLVPNAATDGAHVGIVWNPVGGQAPPPVLFAIVDPTAQTVTNGTVLGHGIPQIVHDGTAFVVAWIDRDGLQLQRIGGARVPLASNATAFAMAADADGVAVVWSDASSFRSARVTRGGEVTYGVPFAPSPYERRFPQLAFDGHRFLLVWRQFLSPIYPHALAASEWRMQLLDETLAPLGDFARVPVSDWPDVAGGANGFVIAGTGPWDVRYVFVDDDGRMPRGVEWLWTNPRAPVHVRWNGANYVAVFGPFAKRLDAAGHVIDDDQRPELVPDGMQLLSVVAMRDSLVGVAQGPLVWVLTPPRLRPVRR